MRKLGFQSGSFSGPGSLDGLYKIEPSSYGFTYRIPVCYSTSFSGHVSPCYLEGLFKIEPSSYGFTYRIPVCYTTSRLLASRFLLCSNPQWTGGFKCRKYGCLSKEMFEKRLWFADPSESQPSQLNER